MKIRSLQIKNLYSYRDTKFNFGDYNVIVGRNASGKTNLIRILKLLLSHTWFQGVSVANYLRFNTHLGSTIRVELEFSKNEIKLLLDSIVKRDTSLEEFDSYYEDYKSASLIIYWKPTFDPAGVTPDFIAIWFRGGIILYFDQNTSKTSIICEKMLPKELSEEEDKMLELLSKHTSKDLESLKGLVLPIIGEPFTSKFRLNVDYLEEMFRKINKLFREEHILKISIDDTIPFHDRNKQYVINAISEIYGNATTFNPSASFWVLFTSILKNNLCFVSEHRPSFEQLAKDLFNLKNTGPLIENYEELKKSFREVFPSVDFDICEREETTQTTTKREKYVIIKEGSNRIRLEDSASGYFEALYILSLISDKKYSILILDEPALHLHPQKITLLGRELMNMKRNQTIIVTHSPYFIDFDLLQGITSKKLIYVKKNGESKAVISESPSSMQRHEFRPEVFFANCVCLVEGPTDRAVVLATSELKDNVLDKNDVVVVDIGSKNNFQKWFDLLNAYSIPFVALGDRDASFNESDRVLKLEKELEDELEKLGWKGGKPSSNEAYDFIKNLEDKKTELFKSKIGKLIDKAIGLINER